ncbi:MAG: D-alanyl-D-alanine carboxypeptidase [Simkania negevensis]|nr:D-alanyl-D-alanine carboxypeptidase [Simkania negevensis]
MKKITLLCLLFPSFFLLARPLPVEVQAKGAIVMNADTGAILFQKNAYEPMYPASVTKIATLLYAVSQLGEGIDKEVITPAECLKRMAKSIKEERKYQDPPYLLEPDGTHFFIRRGERLTVKDLFYGMMLVSGNDAANLIAHHVSGTIPAFMEGMNLHLKGFGCTSTSFLNPHGLHHPDHKTTAYDLALIAKEALKSPLIREIVAATEYERAKTNLQESRVICQKNLLLRRGNFYYPRAFGIKTGYTSSAKHTYVSAAEESGRQLIVVLLGCESAAQSYRDAIHLFEAAFKEKREERLLFKAHENRFSRMIKGAKFPLEAHLLEDLKISYFPAEEPELKIELHWENLFPPIAKEIFVGAIKIFDQNHQELGSGALHALEKVEKRFFLFEVGFLRHLKAVLLALLILGIFAFLFTFFSNSR